MNMSLFHAIIALAEQNPVDKDTKELINKAREIVQREVQEPITADYVVLS